MATPTKPKTEQMDNTGLAIVADEFVGDVIADAVTITDAEFDDSNLADPGDDAGAGTTAFDKVLKITVGGTDYWIPLYDNNTTA